MQPRVPAARRAHPAPPAVHVRLQSGWHGHHHRCVLAQRPRVHDPVCYTLASHPPPTASRAMFRAPLPDARSQCTPEASPSSSGAVHVVWDAGSVPMDARAPSSVQRSAADASLMRCVGRRAHSCCGVMTLCRHSVCELEVDVVAADILNVQERYQRFCHSCISFICFLSAAQAKPRNQ